MIYAAERKLILLVAYKHKKLPYSKRELERHFRRLHPGPLNKIAAAAASKGKAAAAALEAANKAKNDVAAELKAKLNKVDTMSVDDLAKVID